MKRERHSRPHPEGRAVWFTDNLWQKAKALKMQPVKIAKIKEFHMNCWFDEKNPPTCLNVARHAQRIAAADLAYPIILSSDGGLMDGGHRLAKAWNQGLEYVDAVQFTEDPEPDYIEPQSGGPNPAGAQLPGAPSPEPTGHDRRQ